MNKIRRHIFFDGRVQGVGFRYRAYYIAQSLRLTGWVHNCYDGRVEMEVQGLEESIDRMIQQLKKQQYIRIEKMEVKEIKLQNENGFNIR